MLTQHEAVSKTEFVKLALLLLGYVIVLLNYPS